MSDTVLTVLTMLTMLTMISKFAWHRSILQRGHSHGFDQLNLQQPETPVSVTCAYY